MSIDAYLSRIGSRQARQRTGRELAYPTPGNSENFSLTQGQSINIQIPEWQVRCIAVTNLTPFFVHFPDNPAEWQWVPPNTIGAVIPVPAAGRIQVNAADVPGGVTVPTSTLIVQLTAHEDALPASPGAPFVSAASSIAPNLAPNKPPAELNIGIGVNQPVIFAIPAQTIYLFSLEFTIQLAGAAGSFILLMNGSAGPFIGRFPADIIVEHFWAGQGSPLTQGSGLYATVPAGCALQGMIAYSQA